MDIVSPTLASRTSLRPVAIYPTSPHRNISQGSIFGLKYPTSIGVTSDPEARKNIREWDTNGARESSRMRCLTFPSVFASIRVCFIRVSFENVIDPSTTLTNTTTPLCGSNWEEKMSARSGELVEPLGDGIRWIMASKTLSTFCPVLAEIRRISSLRNPNDSSDWRVSSILACGMSILLISGIMVR